MKHRWWACLVLSLASCGESASQPYFVHPELSVMAKSVSGLEDVPAGHVTYNASSAALGNDRFMAVRIDSSRPHRKKQQELAIVAVDEAHRPRGPFAVLSTPHPKGHRPSAEDPRLFAHDGALYVIYSATPVAQIGPNQRRIFMGRLHIDDSGEVPVASLAWARQLAIADDAIVQNQWEKNWTPFSYQGAIHLLYRANPPLVLRMDPHVLADVEVETMQSEPRVVLHALLPQEEYAALVQLLTPPEQEAVPQATGEWRGGTPALFAPELGEYVTFFHTRFSADYGAGHGAQKYYMMGFYTFAAEPPFAMRQYIEAPLQVPELGDQALGTTRIVFPGGIIDEPNQYVITFGREDREVGVASFDKAALFRRLVAVDRLQAVELNVTR